MPDYPRTRAVIAQLCDLGTGDEFMPLSVLGNVYRAQLRAPLVRVAALGENVELELTGLSSLGRSAAKVQGIELILDRQYRSLGRDAYWSPTAQENGSQMRECQPLVVAHPLMLQLIKTDYLQASLISEAYRTGVKPWGAAVLLHILTWNDAELTRQAAAVLEANLNLQPQTQRFLLATNHIPQVKPGPLVRARKTGAGWITSLLNRWTAAV